MFKRKVSKLRGRVTEKEYIFIINLYNQEICINITKEIYKINIIIFFIDIYYSPSINRGVNGTSESHLPLTKVRGNSGFGGEGQTHGSAPTKNVFAYYNAFFGGTG